MLFCTIFVALNILLLPIAYVKGVVHKTKEVTRGCCLREGEAKSKDLSPNATVPDMVLFISLGIPMLLISQVVDLGFFFIHLYTWKAAKLTDEKIQIIDYQSFVILEHLIEEMVQEYNARPSELSNNGHKVELEDLEYYKKTKRVKSKYLVTRLRTDLNIGRQIQILVFSKDKQGDKERLGYFPD